MENEFEKFDPTKREVVDKSTSEMENLENTSKTEEALDILTERMEKESVGEEEIAKEVEKLSQKTGGPENLKNFISSKVEKFRNRINCYLKIATVAVSLISPALVEAQEKHHENQGIYFISESSSEPEKSEGEWTVKIISKMEEKIGKVKNVMQDNIDNNSFWGQNSNGEFFRFDFHNGTDADPTVQELSVTAENADETGGISPEVRNFIKSHAE